MILRFYPTKDSTLYELYPIKNTGLDAVLDISKTISSTASYNSRALLDFDYTAISASIVDLGYDPNDFNYNLKLYTVEANEIPTNYTLYAHAISGSWNMGIGRFSNSPQTVEGVSWTYKGSRYETGSAWTTSSFETNVTASWNVNKGGGTWYTSSAASQSFDYTTTDINMDVTAIMNEVQAGTIPSFNGFIIKKSEEDEQSQYIFNSLKFFSKDTHTIYVPVLEAKYDDSSYVTTLDLIDVDDQYNIIPVNLQTSYSEGSTPKIRFSARYRYPTQTYTTSSLYVERYRLPADTQYAIYSAQSDDIILGFSDYTKVSADATSNYIKLHLDSFQPEQYYRILLRVPNTGSGTSYQILDPKWIFKVTRSQQ